MVQSTTCASIGICIRNWEKISWSDKMASDIFYCTLFYFTDIAVQHHQNDCVTHSLRAIVETTITICPDLCSSLLVGFPFSIFTSLIPYSIEQWGDSQKINQNIYNSPAQPLQWLLAFIAKFKLFTVAYMIEPLTFSSLILWPLFFLNIFWPSITCVCTSRTPDSCCLCISHSSCQEHSFPNFSWLAIAYPLILDLIIFSTESPFFTTFVGINHSFLLSISAYCLNMYHIRKIRKKKYGS